MYCIFCGKQIEDDSLFCPYCGKNLTYREYLYCKKCGQQIDPSSSFCPYCGESTKNSILTKISKKTWSLPELDFQHIYKSRFFRLYIVWFLIQCLLLYKSNDAYSNYFNNSNLKPGDYWGNNKDIYPSDWFYPFRNIFSGIMGQDPVYVYDISEFIIYTLIVPFILALILYKRKSLTKSSRNEKVLYWVIWYASIWLLIFFPMGLFGLDILGWTFSIGGLTIAIYAYYKIKELYANK